MRDSRTVPGQFHGPAQVPRTPAQAPGNDAARADGPTGRPAGDSLLVAMAEYASSHEIKSALAYETAVHCLMDSLACAFQALKFPACTRLMGPVVPGATLSRGARVPGTSYELDPINAAFDIGCMIRWLECNDTWLAVEWGHPSDNLGGILAMADYLSRRGNPITVRDVLTGMIKAHEIQGVLALDYGFDRVGLDAVPLVRVAGAAVLTTLLGGTRAQVIDAVSNAWMDGGAHRTHRQAPNIGSRGCWAAGDATSRAVRLALLALKGEMGYPSAWSTETRGCEDALVGGKALTVPQPFGSHVMENLRFAKCRAEAVPALASKFETSVAAHFGAKQTESIKKLFADFTALSAMPVSDFLARLVSAA